MVRVAFHIWITTREREGQSLCIHTLTTATLGAWGCWCLLDPYAYNPQKSLSNQLSSNSTSWEYVPIRRGPQGLWDPGQA